jgi:hypothetical protein
MSILRLNVRTTYVYFHILSYGLLKLSSILIVTVYLAYIKFMAFLSDFIVPSGNRKNTK